MSDWTDGYVSDIGYTYGYYAELNPIRVKLVFLNAGLAAPEFGTACELGFGQGVSVNVHAAASTCSWHGTDFIPAQAVYARDTAQASGASVHLYDESFSEFSERDLPEFDYIGLHGIWTWISDENRNLIVEFIRKKLKVGGVVYVSYNTLPGWGAIAPLRHIISSHAQLNAAPAQGIVSKINASLDFTEKLIETNPMYTRANSIAEKKFEQIKGQDRQYLAHEYFNRDWCPMYFATMAEWMAKAKLNFACSAHYLDHVDSLNLSSEQRHFLDKIDDQVFKETVRDYMVNQQFRRDYWVKGARQLTAQEKSESINAQKVIMVVNRDDVDSTATGAAGRGTLAENIYNPILDLMKDHKIRSISDIALEVRGHGVTLVQVIEAIMVLCGNNTFTSVQNGYENKQIQKMSNQLNSYLLNKARCNSVVNYLASPVTGAAIHAGRFDQLFLLAFKSGKKDPSEMAKFLSEILKSQGERLLKNGVEFASENELLTELTDQAKIFFFTKLPIFKALHIA